MLLQAFHSPMEKTGNIGKSTKTCYRHMNIGLLFGVKVVQKKSAGQIHLEGQKRI